MAFKILAQRSYTTTKESAILKASLAWLHAENSRGSSQPSCSAHSMAALWADWAETKSVSWSRHTTAGHRKLCSLLAELCWTAEWLGDLLRRIHQASGGGVSLRRIPRRATILLRKLQRYFLSFPKQKWEKWDSTGFLSFSWMKCRMLWNIIWSNFFTEENFYFTLRIHWMIQISKTSIEKFWNKSKSFRGYWISCINYYWFNYLKIAIDMLKEYHWLWLGLLLS